MYAKADVKHTLGLIVIATGAIAVLIAATTAYVAVDSGKPGWFICTAACGLIGLHQIRRGLRMRNAAVAAGSALIETMEQANTGRTSRSGTRRPTFLDRQQDAAEERDEEAES